MPRRICVDACVVVKLVLAESNSREAELLWREWTKSQVDLIAPTLLIFEGASAIRLNVTRRFITQEVADLAFRGFIAEVQNIRLLFSDDLHERAWQIAKHQNQSQVYDAYYLALTESFGCEFWTADDRLYNSVQTVFPWVKHITRFG